MKKYLFLLVFIFSTYFSFTQETFQFTLNNSLRKLPNKAIEDKSGNILTLITEATGTSYGYSDILRSYILKFNTSGDTSCKYFSFGDSVFSLVEIVNVDSGFLISGYVKKPAESVWQLLLMSLDSELNILWKKKYWNPQYNLIIGNIFQSDSIFYMCGFGQDKVTHVFYTYFRKTNLQCDIIAESYFLDDSYSNINYTMNYDKSRIWLFSDCCIGDVNLASRSEFDTEFNYLNTDEIGTNTERLSPHIVNDSSIILSFSGPILSSSHMLSQISTRLVDNNLNLKENHIIGNEDTAYAVSFGQSVDLLSQDSIFILGVKNNRDNKPYQTDTSWILVSRMNSDLNPVFTNFYGGDGYYETYSIIATLDGGCFISAGKFNFITEVYDLVFYKLNGNGLLVGTNEKPITTFTVYPNPTTSGISLHNNLDNAWMTVTDLKGIQLIQKSLNKGYQHVELNDLKIGTYIVGFYQNGLFISSTKISKQ